jgi:hypothetical protein
VRTGAHRARCRLMTGWEMTLPAGRRCSDRYRLAALTTYRARPKAWRRTRSRRGAIIAIWSASTRRQATYRIVQTDRVFLAARRSVPHSRSLMLRLHEPLRESAYALERALFERHEQPLYLIAVGEPRE